MVFLKHSTTALLAVLLLSLASISITSKANAQEVDPCPMTQFLVVDSTSCKPPVKKKVTLTPTEQILLPTPTAQPSELPKTPEKLSDVPVTAPVAPIGPLTAPTATLSADVLFSLVNAHRKEVNLSPLEHDDHVCGVAASRRDEMAQEIFVTHQLHAGFYAKNLSYWATENLIWQHTEAEALNWWLHSPIHKAAIEGSYKYACGVCNGEVCDMVFTNYEPKVQIAVQVTVAAGSTPPPAVTLNPVAQSLPTQAAPVQPVFQKTSEKLLGKN